MSRRSKPPGPPQITCAIYTRKSTEEGLEQEYNTLDAQRDAGEAYIKSQQHEGWVCSPEHYDDGGFTGANMDRPALKRLMADIESGKVNCVMVYKVDRLSRSLLDFARIMETFERNQVSFVSVTQAFNTASSMGRLILNVLLSFAQFEREMISERTRDKIAAARRKGKWSGGMPVLGYNVVDTKLVVKDEEANRVRQIFDMYLEHRSMLSVAKEANNRGWRTKHWTTKKETERGGRVFTKNAVYQLLTNVVYVGKVKYKDEVHDGEHDAIVDSETFARAQALMKRNNRSGGNSVRNKYGALLRGLLRCSACDCGMTHAFTTKGSKRYHYYICNRAQQRGWNACPSPSMPAGEVERFVVDQIKCIGDDPRLIDEVVSQSRTESDAEIHRLDRERTDLRQQLYDCHATLRHLATEAPADDPRLADSQDRIRLAETRLAQVEDELAALQGQQITKQDVASALSDFDTVWKSLPPRDQCRVIELLIECITYDGTSGTIAITFRPCGIHLLINEFSQQTEGAA